MPTLLVTGANGHLGRRVVELLLEAKAGQIVAGTRNPARLADLAERGVAVRKLDFDDPASLDSAFAGVDRALIVSTDQLDGTDSRLRQHERAVAAAVRAGVKHLLYTSMPHPESDSPVPFAYQHRGTEEAIARSGVSWTILRNAWYADLFIATGALHHAVASGTLVGASGDGGAAYVTREDCARAAAAALASGDTTNRIDNITGPSVVTGPELAALVSEVSGKPVTFVQLDPATFKQGLLGAGIPETMADVIVGSDLAKKLGQFALVTTDVLTLTGRQPTTLRAYLESQRQALLAPASGAAAH